MIGNDILADKNICIYLLNGDVNLAQVLQGQNLSISIITEMELCAYHSSPDPLKLLNVSLNSVSIINIDDKVKAKAIYIRKRSRLKLPDRIAAASGMAYNIPLITADKAFNKIEELDQILYESFF